MLKDILVCKRIQLPVGLVLTLFLLMGYSFQSAAGSAYYALVFLNHATVDSSPVILQEGTTGTSTIYTNSTSAKTSVEAPLFDYVDNNEYDVDSSADKGMHSDFPAQQAGPDSTYDTLSEENTEAIEDYVDGTSDVDSSPDIGTHSSFNNMKSKADTYDTLTETALSENEYSIDLTGGYVTVSTADITIAQGTISFWIQFDDVATGRLVGANGDLELRLDTGNVIDFDWGGNDLMSSSNTFTTATWYFFAFTWDDNANDLFFYVGTETSAPTQDANSQDGTYTGTVSTIPQATVYWGNGYGGLQPVNGHMDDIRFYNTVRTLSEILTDYNQTLNGDETGLVNYYKLENDYTDSAGTDDGSLSGSGAFNTDVPSWESGNDYDLELEVQFTNVIDFLPTEKLCIYTGTLSDEDLRVDYWNGTGWENLATDLTAYSGNEYTVSLTSTTFTVRFKGGNETGDTTQDQWQIDASLLRVEGAGGKEDAVDNDTSDADSSSDLGVLTDFTNMTAYDANMANLTETTEGVDGDWGDMNNPGGTSAAQSTARAMGGTSPDVDNMTLTSISVWWGGTGTGRLAVYQGGALDNPTGATLVWDAGEVAIPATAGWVTISGGSTSLVKNEVTWIAWKCDDADYYYETAWDSASDFQSARGRAELTAEGADSTDVWDATIGTFSFGSWWYDMYINYTVPTNYQLDQEVQWTDVPLSTQNENLSIYAGTMGAEDIKVDVWNGTDWETVFTDLSSGWNNASVTDWLATSNFTIRFKGGNETADSSQDAWQIDVALLHFWHDGGESYEVNLEVQWTSADYTRTNEELCIKTGTFSGSENIQARVWNSTGSSWHWLMNLTANQWNNVSIASYLTSSTLTLQFLGGTETGDTTQDSWNIDTTLLHVWSGWLSGWGKRVRITIDRNDVDSALSNFPVLVYLGNTSSGRSNDDVSFIFDELQNDTNRKKIAVTESDGLTQCYIEIEKWDDASEKAWLWVKVPSINNITDTALFLYYDKYHADNTAYVGDTGSTAAQSVWDSSFKGVWHLSETSGGVGTIKDSTSNNNAGTDNGNPAFNATGMIDSAISFDGFDDYINMSNSASLQFTSSLTIEGWVNLESFGSGSDVDVVLRKGEGNPNDYQLAVHDQKLALMIEENDDTGLESSANLAATTWYYLAGAWNGSIGRVYLNGSEDGSGSKTGNIIPDTRDIYIGGRSGTDLSTGVIDEVRASNVTRSAAWVKASYESGRDDLLDFGQEETSTQNFDYVLRVYNTAVDSHQIRLKKYSDSSIDRLQNCTIYFRNSSDDTSRQIYIQNGLYVNQTGPWYDLDDHETIYIVMTVEASTIGTSHIYAYLEVRTPNTTTYTRHIITFEIT